MTEFKPGDRVIYSNPIYNNHPKGKELTLDRKVTSDLSKSNFKHYWILKGGGTGVIDEEITLFKVDNWEEHFEGLK